MRNLGSSEGKEVVVQLFDGNGNIVASESRVLMSLRDHQNKFFGKHKCALEEYCIEDAWNDRWSVRSSLQGQGYAIVYLDANKAKERLFQELQDVITAVDAQCERFKAAVKNGDVDYDVYEMFDENDRIKKLFCEYVHLLKKETLLES